MGQCRNCKFGLNGRSAVFCCDECKTQWRQKHNPKNIRAVVFARDAGICASCGIDTTWFAELWATQAFRYENETGYLGNIEERKRIHRKAMFAGGTWQADHAVPVRLSDRVFQVEDFQTLCGRCHSLKTKAENRKAQLDR
jgi:5-methylcytosine-specific restriction endonuclease McrA